MIWGRSVVPIPLSSARKRKRIAEKKINTRLFFHYALTYNNNCKRNSKKHEPPPRLCLALTKYIFYYITPIGGKGKWQKNLIQDFTNRRSVRIVIEKGIYSASLPQASGSAKNVTMFTRGKMRRLSVTL